MQNRTIRLEDSQNFWINNLDAVERFFMEKVVNSNYPQKIPGLGSDIASKLSSLVRMEKKFVSTILIKVNRVLRLTSKRIVLLFDIDDTLGVSRVPEIEPTTFRPSAVPLLRLLSNHCAIGLISNRLALSFDDLPEIFGLLDTTMIFSSRDASIKNCSELVKIKDFFSDKERGLSVDASNLNKLVQLEIIMQMHEDCFFVAIDDLPYASKIGDHGIYVGPYLQCYL